MNNGCETKPTARSVPAKQASSMLYWDCNLRLVLIATITNTFIIIITGQDPKFRAMENKLMIVFCKKYSLNLPRQLIEWLRAESALTFISFFKGISRLWSVDMFQFVSSSTVDKQSKATVKTGTDLGPKNSFDRSARYNEFGSKVKETKNHRCCCLFKIEVNFVSDTCSVVNCNICRKLY